MEKETKKKSVFESTTTIIDKDTGVIQEQRREVVQVADKEPDYIKLYLDCICTFKGLNKGLSTILIAFCSHMTWADDEESGKQVIFVNSITKKSVAKKVGVGVDRLNKALKDIVEAGIFRRIARGCYEVNPFIIAKGKWSDIKTLRANFDFMNGTIEPVIEEVTEDGHQIDIDELDGGKYSLKGDSND